MVVHPSLKKEDVKYNCKLCHPLLSWGAVSDKAVYDEDFKTRMTFISFDRHSILTKNIKCHAEVMLNPHFQTIAL